MKKFFVIVILTSLSSLSFGKEVKVTVNGMVCSFCAQGIHKKLSAQEAVKSVDVSLSNHIVKVELKDGKDLDDKTITQILTDAGYSVSRIERM